MQHVSISCRFQRDRGACPGVCELLLTGTQGQRFGGEQLKRAGK
jgi:hypothetical protein